jgi:hypothetical protein
VLDDVGGRRVVAYHGQQPLHDHRRQPEREHLLLAAGEEARATVRRSRGAGKWMYACSASSSSPRWESRKLGDGEAEEDTLSLRDVDETVAREAARVAADDVLACEANGTGHRWEDAGNRSQRRRFAARRA